MDAGQLRERITIEIEARTPNGQGGFTIAWASVSTSPVVWAEVIGLNGSEAIRAGIERSVSVYRINMRQRSDISARNRLQWNGQVLAIKSVLPHPDEPKAFLQLLCETGVGSV